MNKSIIIVTVFFLLSVVFSEAILAKEIQQGTVEVSGGFDLSFSAVDVDVEGDIVREIDTQMIDTSISYYFTPNIGLGVLWRYENSETTSRTFSTEVTTNIIGPHLTFNLSLNDKTSLKLKGAVLITSTEFSSSFSTTEEADGFGWAIQGGLSYFVMESVSFNGGIAYSSLSTEIDSTNTDFDVTDLSVGVGVSVYIF